MFLSRYSCLQFKSNFDENSWFVIWNIFKCCPIHTWMQLCQLELCVGSNCCYIDLSTKWCCIYYVSKTWNIFVNIYMSSFTWKYPTPAFSSLIETKYDSNLQFAHSFFSITQNRATWHVINIDFHWQAPMFSVLFTCFAAHIQALIWCIGSTIPFIIYHSVGDVSVLVWLCPWLQLLY